jgi:hypothetical protein
MNSKTTWLLLALAALLAGFIVGWEKFVAGPARQPVFVLPGFKPGAITAVQVRVASQPELFAERATNGGWQLARPLPYPAQAGAIEALLAALAKLTPDSSLSARELMSHTNLDADFGFDAPLATLALFSEGDRKQVIVGARTAPGGQVFVEVVGVPGVHLVPTNLLGVIPKSPGEWRDTALLDWASLKFDRLQVASGARTMELQRGAPDNLWRLPRLHARADSLLVDELLKRLQAVQVAQFITDNPRADLDAYGLQTPELEMTFSLGTNIAAALHFGRSPTNDAKLLFARRAGSDSVVAVPAAAFEQWRAPASEFRDRHLVSLQSLPASIEIAGEDRFTLVHQTNNHWRVMPQDFAADTSSMNDFILTLAQMRVAQFVKDVVTGPDLPAYGLATPRREYILKAGANGTNGAAVRLLFGTNHDEVVFGKRADEDSVFSVKQADFNRLPAASWEMRERRIWTFTEDDVARVTIEQEGRKRELVRSGTNTWSLAPGSFGVINTFAIEETVHRLGELSAAFWTARGAFDRAKFGFTDKPHRLTIELKDGTKREVEFGGNAPSQFPYAVVTLGGGPWLFEFPWPTYQFIESYLSIPVREL